MHHVFTNVLAELLDPRPNLSIIFLDMSFQWGSDWQLLPDNIVASIYHVTRYSRIPGSRESDRLSTVCRFWEWKQSAHCSAPMCPAYMSDLRVRPTCPAYVSDLHVRPTWLAYVSTLRVQLSDHIIILIIYLR